MKAYADATIKRMVDQAYDLSKKTGYDFSPALQKGQPRWKVGPRWIEFECGCVAERIERLAVPKENYDPIIFDDLHESDGTTLQAVYHTVCPWHVQGMYDNRIKFSHRFATAGGYSDFQDWFNRRRPKLMGRANERRLGI